MSSHKNTKRQGELAQCIKYVSVREKNASEGESETGGETVATDDGPLFLNFLDPPLFITFVLLLVRNLCSRTLRMNRA